MFEAEGRCLVREGVLNGITHDEAGVLYVERTRIAKP